MFLEILSFNGRNHDTGLRVSGEEDYEAQERVWRWKFTWEITENWEESEACEGS